MSWIIAMIKDSITGPSGLLAMMMSTFWDVFFKTFLAWIIMDDDGENDVDDDDDDDGDNDDDDDDEYLFHWQAS